MSDADDADTGAKPAAGTAWRRLCARLARRAPHGWVFACAALAMATVLAANSYILWEFHQTALADAKAGIVKLAQVYAEAASRTLQGADRVAAAMAGDLAAVALEGEAAWRRGAASPETHRLLAAKRGGMAQLEALDLVGADGTLLNSSRAEPLPPGIVVDRSYIDVLRRHPQLDRVLAAPPRYRGSGTWAIFLARRVNGPGGVFLGAVVATVPLDYLAEFYRHTDLGPGSSVALWRDNGTLLVRYPADAGAAGGAKRQFALDSQAQLAWVAREPDVVPSVVAQRRLRDYPLVMTVSLTEDAIFAQWRIQVLVIGSAALVGIVVIGFVALLVRRHLIAREQVAKARAEIEFESRAREELEREIARADAAILELEHAAAALRESEQRFRDIAEVAADVIWETGPDHRFTLFAGDSVHEIENRIGLPVSELLGKTRWELAGADPQTDESWRRHKADLDAHRPFRGFRYKVTTAAGRTIHYAVYGKPVFDNAGRFVGYRGVGTNETEIVEARSRAERAEALLRDAVDSISEGFVIYDADDRLVLCNEAFRKLYPENADMLVPGTRFEDIVRSGLKRGLYQVPAGHEEEWFAKRLEEHRNPAGPIEAAHSNGRWLLISERRMQDGGTAGLRIDITALKAVQAALRESEDRLNRAQRLARMGSDTRDPHTDHMEWSDETYRIFGVDRATFVPNTPNFLQLVHPDDRAIILKGRDEVARGICPKPYEYRVVRPDKSIRHIYRESELLCDDNGRPVMVYGLIRDITELRAAEARQKELERQLQHSQRLKALGTLAGGIAHDLNNTLVPILSLSRLIAERMPADSADRADLETIIFASERARDLLQQILAFSRKQPAVKRETDLASITRKSLQMMRATAPESVRIVEEIDEVAPIMADAGQLQQVIVNLVTNGIQAIGKAAGTITVRLVRLADAGEGAALCLSVADTGCGMDAATLERIFEPFYTNKPVGEGTGLGLSVVHGIVAAHGGRIEVDSKPKKGTRFRVILPLDSGDAAAGAGARAAA